MSISAISNGLSTSASSTPIQSNLRQFQQEFQQLGSDLKSGNMTAAKQDFAQLHTLAGEGGDVSSGPSTPGGSALVEQFNQLGQDIVSGNISAAGQAYGNLKQDFQRVDQEHDNPRSHVNTGLQTGGQQGPANPVGPATPADPGGLSSPTLPSAAAALVQSAYASMLQGLQDFGSEALPSAFPSTSISV
jgi:hypothetical protein